MKRRRVALALILVLILSVGASAQEPEYRGNASREIKALSPEQIEQLISGSGMGLALAGELNRYPGPKHVLELADRLQLTKAQRMETQALYDEMLRDARRLGKAIVDWEGNLDQLFATGRISEQELGAALDQIAELNARLRYVHLSAHLRMKALLTESQIETYSGLRGYTSGTGTPSNDHQGHRGQ